MNLQYPNITGKTPVEQIIQLRGFLIQLVDQLNIEENSRAAAVQRNVNPGAQTAGGTAQNNVPDASPAGTFNQIKSLIIKSADIVNAYYEEINKHLVGKYVAQSDYGTFVEETTAIINVNSKAIEQNYIDQQAVLDGLTKWQGDTKACIKSGLLYYEDEDGNELTGVEAGTAVYGIELRQTNKDSEGNEVFNKFARFTASGVIFYDSDGDELVYFTNNQTLFKNAKVEGTFTRGKYVETIAADGSSVERWVSV